MNEGMKIHRFWTVLAKKTDSKIQWDNSFYCDNTLCGQYHCYLYIHLLMSVSSDQATYYSSLCMLGENAGTHWKLLRRVVSLDKNYIIIIIIKNRNFCRISDCKHLYLQYWWYTSAEMPWASYNMKQYLHIASSQCRGDDRVLIINWTYKPLGFVQVMENLESREI